MTTPYPYWCVEYVSSRQEVDADDLLQQGALARRLDAQHDDSRQLDVVVEADVAQLIDQRDHLPQIIHEVHGCLVARLLHQSKII